MKKVIFILFTSVLFLVSCGFQEKLIFYPTKLESGYKFVFDQEFEEINVKTTDNKLLNAILFKADTSKGVIFYLHGNAGALNSWGNVAKTFTNLNYDVFMLDYRGYGKSEGKINGQSQIFQDIQTAYDKLKTNYSEDKIIILGFSIGTGLAAKVASTNNPRLLILQAPYYSLIDLKKHIFPIIPTFILKYKFETNVYIKSCKMPIVIFHGNQDEVIYYGSSLKLQKEFKAQDILITLNGQGHNGIEKNREYKIEIEKILTRHE